MIVVIDYCVGNVRSVCNALDYIGCENRLSAEQKDIEQADGIILPGVAAFGFAVNALGKSAELVIEAANSGKPLLGICVGYQMLFDSSSELGEHKGLGLIEGRVVPLPADKGLTVPHMGWNEVAVSPEMHIFDGMRDKEYMYFAHSFHAEVQNKSAAVAYTDYGGAVVASIQKDNIYGVQFHPEKSSDTGLEILRNFEKICMNRI
ncbi:Imidazole glycerol phosphate synthase subunit HisH 1 [Limihaloglobus sulfuriphilus]|uniref:Imidazole glycerol phosphate synthase subunit HisH n=1 Tax=Limihaloglobus sulfuriphilus TaxID=1851148 RepID=A0A1Q2MBJ5_9BACT|nr:imidazole glycerol phosphate synthase subunit HisH [Limihaloglobus sulfuriphilus]AQQ70029.1 Imidazole glycerol phosphate synthase subunit HisH 1 [Limihaloglobus sulfuriphilus]